MSKAIRSVGGRVRGVISATAVIVLAAGLFTCSDKDNSPIGPDGPSIPVIPPHLGTDFVDKASGGMVSSIAGKIGVSLAGMYLNEIGLGSVAEFLGLSEGPNRTLEHMSDQLNQLINEVAVIDSKLDGISKQINDLENLLSRNEKYSTAWTSFTFFLDHYGSVQGKNNRTFASLQSIEGDYAEVMAGNMSKEKYNMALADIWDSWYTRDNHTEYDNLSNMADAIMGKGTSAIAPGIARYSLESAYAENNTQALPGYFNFLNRMFTDFSLGVLLCSGAMKFTMESDTNSNRNLIRGHMIDLRDSYIKVLNYLYAAPEPEYVLARKQYELFSTAQGKTTDDYVYFYAQGNTPAQPVMKDSTNMTTVHKDLVVLTPGQRFTPDVHYGTVGSSRGYRLTSFNSSAADVVGNTILAASPGFARVVVSSQKGVANFFVHVIDTTQTTDAASIEFDAGTYHFELGKNVMYWYVELWYLFPDIELDDIYNFTWQTDCPNFSVGSEAVVVHAPDAAYIYGEYKSIDGKTHRARVFLSATNSSAVANAVSSPEELFNALDSNKNITLINNIDLTRYKSVFAAAAANRNLGDLIPSHSVGSDDYFTHGRYWRAFLSVPSSYQPVSQKDYTSVLDGNGFTIILPGAVLLSKIGESGQVKNLTVYFNEYYSQITGQSFDLSSKCYECKTAKHRTTKSEEWEVGLNALTVENHGLIENVALIGAQTSARSANIMIAGANYGTISLCLNQQTMPTAGPSPLNASLAFANLATGIIQGSGAVRTVQSRSVLVGYNSGGIMSCFIRALSSADAAVDYDYYEDHCIACLSQIHVEYEGTHYNNPVLVNAANYGSSGRIENSFAYSASAASYARLGGWAYNFTAKASTSDVWGDIAWGDGDSYYAAHESNNVSGQNESTMKSAATLATLNTGLGDGISWETGTDGFPWPVGPGGHLQSLQKRRVAGR